MAQALAALVRPGAVAIASPASDPALPPPEHGRPFQFPFFHEPVSYHEAMETRLVRGDWGSGRVAAWMRQRVPLVAGTPTSPLERVLVAADSGSGVSAAIEHKRFTAINADLTVSVHRPLEGEWVGMDCLSIYELPMIDSTKFAIDDINAQGGVLGRKLRLVQLDAQSNNQIYAEYATKLLVEDKVAVLMGGITSASREAVRPVVGKYKHVYFYNEQYEGGVCDKLVFCTGVTPAQQLGTLIPWAVKEYGKIG